MKQVEDIRTYIWIEFAIWFVLLCLVIGGVRIHRYFEMKELNTYQIFLPDVDGLIVGSPVRYMGVQVGYINKIKIVNSDIYVKFIVTDKELNLPKGVIATVEFNGLGGSKSLEIFPPTEESLASNKLIFIHTQMRLNDSLGLLNDMFDKIASISSRLSFFVNETDLIDNFLDVREKFNAKDVGENIKTVETWINKYSDGRKEKINNKNKEQNNE